MKTKTRTLWTFAITSLALFMVTLDNLVVTTALPVIRRDLHASLQSLEWTVNAYTLTFAVLLLTGDQDQLIPPDKAKTMAATVRTATLTIVESAGHLPMLEQPDVTRTAIRSFISKIEHCDWALISSGPTLRKT